jgi:predicted kinase
VKTQGMAAAVLVAVAGQAGSGKSRLAARIVERLGARRIDVSSDLSPYPDGVLYAQAITSARAGLASGSSIVLVGPFHTREARRGLLRLASETRSALLYVECSANESVRARRIRRRLMSGPDALSPAEAALWVGRLQAEDTSFERTGSEIPRAAQMLVETTVGIDIWGGLAASRVEAWIAGAIPLALEDQALSAG